MTRPVQQTLFPSVVDESLPTGSCEGQCDSMLVTLAVKCFDCGSTHRMTHCGKPGPQRYNDALTTYHKLMYRDDTMREGGTETETANGGDSPINNDPRSDEEFQAWRQEDEASEIGSQPAERPKAKSASKAKSARKAVG